jgi:hypothetical protein
MATSTSVASGSPCAHTLVEFCGSGDVAIIAWSASELLLVGGASVDLLRARRGVEELRASGKGPLRLASAFACCNKLAPDIWHATREVERGGPSAWIHIWQDAP